MRQNNRNSSNIRYNAIGSTVVGSPSNTVAGIARVYVPGLGTVSGVASGDPLLVSLPGSAGRDLVQSYSTAKFLPGTTVTWTPSVGFVSTGRIYVGFTDNPEVIEALGNKLASAFATDDGAQWLNYGNNVKSLQGVYTSQIFESFTLQVPTTMRRKRFDVNSTMGWLVDNLDRCCQVAMFAYFDGISDSSPGSFVYTDNIDVEGIRERNLS